MVSRLSAFACQESRHQLREVRQAGWAHGTGVARWMCEVHSDPERGVWKDISGAETVGTAGIRSLSMISMISRHLKTETFHDNEDLGTLKMSIQLENLFPSLPLNAS